MDWGERDGVIDWSVEHVTRELLIISLHLSDCLTAFVLSPSLPLPRSCCHVEHFLYFILVRTCSIRNMSIKQCFKILTTTIIRELGQEVKSSLYCSFVVYCVLWVFASILPSINDSNVPEVDLWGIFREILVIFDEYAHKATYAQLAQSVEHASPNLRVVASSPTLGDFFFDQ